MREGVQRLQGRAIQLVQRQDAEGFDFRTALRFCAALLQLLADAVFQFCGGCVRKGDRRNLAHRHAALHEVHDPAHQCGGLPGAGACLDKQRLAENGSNSVARGLVLW